MASVHRKCHFNCLNWHVFPMVLTSWGQNHNQDNPKEKHLWMKKPWVSLFEVILLCFNTWQFSICCTMTCTKTTTNLIYSSGGRDPCTGWDTDVHWSMIFCPGSSPDVFMSYSEELWCFKWVKVHLNIVCNWVPVAAPFFQVSTTVIMSSLALCPKWVVNLHIGHQHCC